MATNKLSNEKKKKEQARFTIVATSSILGGEFLIECAARKSDSVSKDVILSGIKGDRSKIGTREGRKEGK